jgi:hypothetical protein
MPITCPPNRAATHDFSPGLDFRGHFCQVGANRSNVYFADSLISAASARVRRLISSALKRRMSCGEYLGEAGCGDFLLSSSNATANRSTTDVESKKSNNPEIILVGIRVTDKKSTFALLAGNPK